MIVQATLNSNDIFQTYGVGIRSGLKNMSAPAVPKIGQESDYPEVNGKQYILNDKLQDIDVTLLCWIRSNSIADFKTKLSALETELRTTLVHEFWVAKTNTTYDIKYNKISSFDWITNDNNAPFAKFNLEITILQDALNQPAITLILDGNG